MAGVTKHIGNLSDVVDAYLTNGRYDPNKSQRRAEDYKNKMQTIEERRRDNYKRSKVYFTRMEKLVESIPTHMSNEDHFKTLSRPEGHSVAKHTHNLRTPNTLVQNNKYKGEVRQQTPKKKKSYGESKLIHPHSRIKPSTTWNTVSQTQ